MSTQADELEHIIYYIAIYIEGVTEALSRKLKRLEEISVLNGFVGADTSEATHLRVAAADLRKLAERIEMRRMLLEGKARERVS